MLLGFRPLAPYVSEIVPSSALLPWLPGEYHQGLFRLWINILLAAGQWLKLDNHQIPCWLTCLCHHWPGQAWKPEAV
jgi:hypothetical protein